MSSNISDSTEDKANSVLYELGLNEYESRAYLTILEGGIIVAREISDRSSIPYAKVYQVLESLVTKRLIIGDKARPRKFRCIDPEEGLMNRLNAIEEDWREKQNRRKNIVENALPELSRLYNAVIPKIVEEQGVWTIIGLTNIMSRISKLISNTSSMLRISAGGTELVLTKLNRVIFNIDLNFKVLIRAIDKIDEFKKYGTVISVSSIGKATTMIFDDFAHICIVETNKGKYGSGEYSAILTQISEVVKSNIIDFDMSINIGE